MKESFSEAFKMLYFFSSSRSFTEALFDEVIEGKENAREDSTIARLVTAHNMIVWNIINGISKRIFILNSKMGVVHFLQSLLI